MTVPELSIIVTRIQKIGTHDEWCGFMLTFYILLFAILSSYSVLEAALDRHDYEECVPCCLFGIAAVLYVFGLLQALSIGVYAVLLLAAAMYGGAFIQLARTRRFRAFAKRLFTPCFYALLALYLIFIYAYHGLLASTPDEFSHWIDILRVMCLTDGFGAAREARSYFATYPPSVSLLQYLAIAVERLLRGRDVFTDSLAFLMYRILSFSLLLPFLGRVRGRSRLGFGCFALAAFSVPLILYEYSLGTLFVDPLLGMLAGFCFAYPLLPLDSGLKRATWLLALFTCALAKSAGAVFAAAAAITWSFARIANAKGRSLGIGGKRVPMPALALGAVGVAYGSWALYLRVNTPLFSNPFPLRVSPADLLHLFVGGGDTDVFRRSIVRAFAGRLFEPGFAFYGVSVSFLMLFFLLIAGIIFLLGRGANRLDSVKPHAFIIGLCGAVAAYLAGLCASYLFGFSQAEASTLASFHRYAAVALVVLLVCLYAALCLRWKAAPVTRIQSLALALLLIVTFPYSSVSDAVIRRETVNRAYQTRQRYDAVAYCVKAAIREPEANIFLISQQSTDRDDF